MRHLIALATAVALPQLALAVGTETDAPPKPTETSSCEDGLVWDEDAEKCVAPKESSLTDDQLYEAARELAYAGRLSETLHVLAAMSDQQDDRVLTYKGFVARGMGDMEGAETFYQAALSANPDNLLARSYMGQGFVEQGRIEEAFAQLAEIRARGDEGGWPAEALETAILTGSTTTY